MKILLEPTPEMFNAPINQILVPCRIWKGKTDRGTPIEAYIIAIVPAEPGGDLEDEADFLKPAREVYTIDISGKKPT